MILVECQPQIRPGLRDKSEPGRTTWASVYLDVQVQGGRNNCIACFFRNFAKTILLSSSCDHPLPSTIYALISYQIS